MNDREQYINTIEEKLNRGGIPSFKKYRFYQMAEAMQEQMDIQNGIAPDKCSVVFMIDEHNAIIEHHSPVTHDGKYFQYSAVLNDKDLSRLFPTVEEALLHWVGVKKEGCNSQFYKYAWNMLREEE